jgi:hypothetical protein
MAEIAERFTFMIARMAPVDDSDEVYVRESDYAALLERHRKAVEVLREVVEYGHHDTCSSSLVSGLVDKFDCSCPHKLAVAFLARMEVKP